MASTQEYPKTIDYQGSEWRDLRREVLHRDQNRCQYCGMKAASIVHHVIMVAAGGSTDLENLVSSCTFCHEISYMKNFRSFESRKTWILAERAKRTAIVDRELPHAEDGEWKRIVKRKKGSAWRKKQRLK